LTKATDESALHKTVAKSIQKIKIRPNGKKRKMRKKNREICQSVVLQVQDLIFSVCLTCIYFINVYIRRTKDTREENCAP